LPFGRGRGRIAACSRLIQSGRLRGNDLASLYVDRSFEQHRQNQHDAALADANAAIKLDPKRVSAFHTRGSIHAAKRMMDEAIADYGTAIRLDPKYRAAYLRRGMICAERNSQVAVEGVRRLEQGTAAAQSTAQQSAAAAGSDAAWRAERAGTSVQAGKRVALVIGNGAYAHAAKLQNPANDATDIAAALRKLGFDVVEGRDLGKLGIEDKVREFGRKLDQAELALFFYAGHGMQVGGKNYVVPTDAKLERAGDLTLDTIDVGQVLAQMESEPRVNLVFLDAWRDNPLARSFARSLGTRSTAVGSGLASIQSAIGTMIAYATEPDKVALDGSGRNSPFTAALLKHLATPGLDIGSVMRRVRTDVVQATRGKQVPWDHSSLMGDVVLAR
jgi:hypothetical protein